MTDKEKLEKIKKLADEVYYAAMYLTTDASRLHKAMDEYHKFIIRECKKEPKECMYSKDNYTDEDRKVLCEDCKEKCAYAIAVVISTNAQVKKDPISENLAEAAIQYAKSKHTGEALQKIVAWDFEAGANWQKEQLMKDAVDGEIQFGTVKVQKEDIKEAVKSQREGEKVKLIVIKK